MSLSATQVKNTKPQDKPYKLADERGLYLLINPSGSKLWRLKYRFSGTEKKLSFGVYPDVSLADTQATKIITQTLKLGLIKPANIEHPRSGYVPFWA